MRIPRTLLLGGLLAGTLWVVAAGAQDYGQDYRDVADEGLEDLTAGPQNLDDIVPPHELMEYEEALALGITPALPEVEGAVPWDLLTTSTLGYDERFDELRPMFPPEVRALAGTTVRIVGFNIPLDSSGHRILLSLISPSCPFCLPGGPETMVEVEAVEAIDAALEPIVLEGTFELIGEEVWTGLYFYRLSGARRVS